MAIQQRTGRSCHLDDQTGSLSDRQVRNADQRKTKGEHMAATGKQGAVGSPEGGRQGLARQDSKLSIPVIRVPCFVHTTSMTHHTCARLSCTVDEVSWGLSCVNSNRTIIQVE